MSAYQDGSGDLLTLGGRPRPPRRPSPRRWLIGMLCAAVVAAVPLILALARDNPARGIAFRSHRPELIFTARGHYVDAIVRGKLDSPREFRAEFLAHGFNFRLILIPCVPPMVGGLSGLAVDPGAAAASGQVIETERTVEDKSCRARHRPGACRLTLRTKVSFRGKVTVYFCRAARPGERYLSVDEPATAPGEMLHGLSVSGKTVARVLAMLASRHVRVAQILDFAAPRTRVLRLAALPRTWYVYDVMTYAPGEVELDVGPARKAHRPGAAGAVSLGP